MRAHELCRAHGASFLLVYAPTKFRVYGRLTEFAAGAVPLTWRPTHELPTRLEEMARRDLPGSVFLDLTPAFQAEAARGSLLYIPEDTHWTPSGHRLAADQIARALGTMAASDTVARSDPPRTR